MYRVEGPASPEQIRTLVLDDHGRTRFNFVQLLGLELEEAIKAATGAYNSWHKFDTSVVLDQRTATVDAFAYTALNSLLTSLHLLVSGLLVPSGNLMRHYGEAVAMALLCSHSSLDVFTRYDKAPKKYPVQGSLSYVQRRRVRELLGIESKTWATFVEITGFYDQYSHASNLSVRSQLMFGPSGGLALLGEMDPDKLPGYKIELIRRESGAEVLDSVITELSRRLPRKAASTGPV